MVFKLKVNLKLKLVLKMCTLKTWKIFVKSGKNFEKTKRQP